MLRRKKPWCCAGFKAHYEAAGERGFAILVGRDFRGESQFTLQHRAIDEGLGPPDLGDLPISVVTETGMNYCPWCGQSLERWYKNRIDELTRPGLRISDKAR